MSESDAAKDWKRIGPDSKINDILGRYPSVGQILVQLGRGYVNRLGDLYAQYPDLTVAQYAEMNQLDPAAVARRLRAAAESDELARKATPAHPADVDRSVRRLPLSIGYTSSYDEREGLGPGSVPVTLMQPERGPV